MVKTATYQIVGEVHLNHLLDYITRINTKDHTSEDFLGLAMSCESLKALINQMHENPKYLFREGTGPEDCVGNHSLIMVQSLIEKIAENTNTEVIYLDTERPTPSFFSGQFGEMKYHTDREKIWTELIAQKDCGLISIGDAHTPRLKKRIERKNWNPLRDKNYSVEVIFRPDLTGRMALDQTHIEVLKQVYDAAPYKNRYEIESLKHFIDNFSVDDPMKLVRQHQKRFAELSGQFCL